MAGYPIRFWRMLAAGESSPDLEIDTCVCACQDLLVTSLVRICHTFVTVILFRCDQMSPLPPLA
jgi:hypothetical protein